MIQLVKEYGTKHWGNIGKQLKDRTGKQCRERWHNQLDPSINKNPWSADEEALLIKLHNEKGNKWADIAKHIPGRTDNTIKNHWNSAKRRLNRHNNGKIGPDKGGHLGELDLHLRGSMDGLGDRWGVTTTSSSSGSGSAPRNSRAFNKRTQLSGNTSSSYNGHPDAYAPSTSSIDVIGTETEENIEETSNALLFMQSSPMASMVSSGFSHAQAQAQLNGYGKFN